MSPLRSAPPLEAGARLPDPPSRGRPDRVERDARLRRRRAFALVLMTLVLPGSAQVAAGNRRVGRVALRTWLVLWTVAVGCGVVFLVDRSLMLGLLGRAWFLALVEGVLLGVAAVWAVLFVDAWRLARPARLGMGARRLLSALTAVLMVLTTGGLMWAATAVDAGRAAVVAIFGGSHAVTPTDGRYNILLLGADTGRGRVGTRPDSIQLVSVDARTGRAVTFGFSRDTENIDFRRGSVMRRLIPGGWNCGDGCLLNGLYTWATDHRAQFPSSVRDPGALATREAVEALSGLDVHYYVMVDLDGFRNVIDALGGLDITVGTRTPIGGGTSPVIGWIQPGRQHMDGYHALWYARSRQGSTNYERMARQRCVTAAMLEQLDPQAVLLRFQSIASATSGVLQTDVPQSELGYLADLALKARSHRIRSVDFVPPLIKPWDYDPRFVTRTVRAAIRASEEDTDPSRPTAAASPSPSLGTAPQSGISSAVSPTSSPTQPATSTSGVTTTGPTSTTTTAPTASASKPTRTSAATEFDLSAVCQAG
jgi:polyisoprenyl-teichoic acid--peptidoglycan teichoic acid transferase